MAGGGFNLETRQTFQRQNVIPFVANQPQNINIPQVGLLARIRLLISGTTNTPASTSVMRVAYPPALYNLVQQVTLRSNEGTDIIRLTGYGCVINEMLQRTAFMQKSELADIKIPGAPQTVQSRLYNDGGDLGASASTNWQFMLTLPIALGEQNLTGMLMAQNPGVNFQLEVLWGNINQVYTVGGTGTPTLTNVQALVLTEFFHLPELPEDDPDLGFVRRIIEENQSITGTGDVIYTPPQGNIYLKFAHILENNSLPIDMSQITSWRVVYAQSQTAYNHIPDVMLYQQRERYGMNLPEGVYVWDWTYGNGLPENPSSRDAFDSGFLTDFRSIPTLASGLSLTNAKIRTIRDELVEAVS